MITVTWGSDHALAYQNATSARVLGARELGLPLDVAFAELGQGSLSALDRVLQTGEVLEMRHREVRILDVHGARPDPALRGGAAGLGTAARGGGHDRGGRHLPVPGRAVRPPGDAGHRDHRADERQRRPGRRTAGADRPAGARRRGPRRGLRHLGRTARGWAAAASAGSCLHARHGPARRSRTAAAAVTSRRTLAVGRGAGRRAHGPHRRRQPPRGENRARHSGLDRGRGGPQRRRGPAGHRRPAGRRLALAGGRDAPDATCSRTWPSSRT